LLAYFHFILLPSTYGELGIDLQITGLDIELACRCFCMYKLLCGLAVVEKAFSRSLFIGQLLIARLRSISFSFSSIAWITWISPYEASLVSSGQQFYDSIARGFYKLSYNFFLSSFCLLVAFWFDPSIAFLFDLWFVLHICLLLGCLSHGCYHPPFLPPV